MAQAVSQTSVGLQTNITVCKPPNNAVIPGLKGYKIPVAMLQSQDENHCLPQYNTLVTQFLIDEPPRYEMLSRTNEYSTLHRDHPQCASTIVTMESSEDQERKRYSSCPQIDSFKLYLCKIISGAFLMLTFIVTMAILRN